MATAETGLLPNMMPVAPPPPEARERPQSIEHYSAFHGRAVLLRDNPDALDPLKTMRNLVPEDTARDIDFHPVENAATNSTKKYYEKKGNTLQEQEVEFVENLVLEINRHADFFATEDGERWKTILHALGFDSDSFKQGFSEIDGRALLSHVRTNYRNENGIKAISGKLDGILHGDNAIERNLDVIGWVASMLAIDPENTDGQNRNINQDASIQAVTQTIVVGIRRVHAGDRLIADANKAGHNVNNPNDDEKRVMKFIRDYGYGQQPDNTQIQTPTQPVFVAPAGLTPIDNPVAFAPAPVLQPAPEEEEEPAAVAEVEPGPDAMTLKEALEKYKAATSPEEEEKWRQVAFEITKLILQGMVYAKDIKNVPQIQPLKAGQKIRYELGESPLERRLFATKPFKQTLVEALFAYAIDTQDPALKNIITDILDNKLFKDKRIRVLWEGLDVERDVSDFKDADTICASYESHWDDVIVLKKKRNAGQAANPAANAAPAAP